MACMKCGSGWVTLKGKDMVSCPECCKQQRCKARKQGRLPDHETKLCERCGAPFRVVGGNAIARSTKCSSCLAVAEQSRERQKRYQARVKAGLKVPGTRDKLKASEMCKRCGKPLDCANQSKYCGRQCFLEARKAGQQSWDRTRQLESVWHRGGRWANAPSTKYIGVLNEAMQSVLNGWDEFRRMLTSGAGSTCEICGASTYGPKARFCSMDCLAKSERTVPCYKCGGPAVAKGVARRKMCQQCFANAEKEYRKRIKKEQGTYRKRCRKYGGHYNAEVTRPKVFERDGYKCHVCGKKALKHWANNDPSEATVDHHPIPLSHGGDHDWHNVRCAHRQCNAEKTNRWDGQRRLALTD